MLCDNTDPEGFVESAKGDKVDYVSLIIHGNGRKAVPLALLGADVTVFDISEENKRYALELAEAANTHIE